MRERREGVRRGKRYVENGERREEMWESRGVERGGD